VGVLCQRRSITRPVRLVAAFNPHPDPPPDYRERGKRLWRINLRSPGKPGTLGFSRPECGCNTLRADLAQWLYRWMPAPRRDGRPTVSKSRGGEGGRMGMGTHNGLEMATGIHPAAGGASASVTAQRRLERNGCKCVPKLAASPFHSLGFYSVPIRRRNVPVAPHSQFTLPPTTRPFARPPTPPSLSQSLGDQFINSLDPARYSVGQRNGR
jgi:hypothetical protein